MEKELEWVNYPLKDGRTGFYRKVSYTRRNPTVPMLEARLQFALAAQAAADETGNRAITVEGKTKEVAPAAMIVHEVRRGDKMRQPQPRSAQIYLPPELRRRIEEAKAGIRTVQPEQQ